MPLVNGEKIEKVSKRVKKTLGGLFRYPLGFPFHNLFQKKRWRLGWEL
jgi:hypothetical protein